MKIERGARSSSVISMRRVVLCSLLCLSLAACARDVAKQDAPTPATSATPTARPTLSPTPQPRPTLSPTPSPTPTATATPQPAPPAAPTATGEASVDPIIHYFYANVEEADPGDAITLEWESTGAANAILYHLMASGQFGQHWEVDTTGTFAYEIHPDARNYTRFYLYVWDEAERSADATLTIELRCPDSWFFSPAPDECPSAAIFSDAVEQHFERGVMIWVKDRWAEWTEEEGWIIVLYGDEQFSPKWQTFTDDWKEGDPDNDPTLKPPSGRYQPVRGFGLVWRQQPEVRYRLGWAIDQETSFSTAVQRTTRYKYNETYLRALDGNVWRLEPEASGWEKIAVEN